MKYQNEIEEFLDYHPDYKFKLKHRKIKRDIGKIRAKIKFEQKVKYQTYVHSHKEEFKTLLNSLGNKKVL